MTREEAIKILRELHDKSLFSVRNAIETLIPELAESEDERIRKEIRNFLIDMECKKEWITYLEKQKEQKPAELNTRDIIISRATSEKQVVLLSESNGSAKIGWDTRSLEDAKNLLEKGLAFINKEIERIAGLGSGTDYATAESRYSHLFKQQEWSEEDEKMLIGIIERGNSEIPKGECALTPNQVAWLETRLKSLRSRPKTLDNWKPSKEQMEVMAKATLYFGNSWVSREQKVLESLYNDLEKLMEE